jgi:hypothetical protein
MEKINEINKVIAAYFDLNKSLDIVPAKELMPNFIKAGIFPKDNKNGLPIRNILRKLDSNNELYHIPSVIAERKAKNTNWFFGRNLKTKVVPFEKSNTPKHSETKPKASGKRKDSDEHYIINLCDELLKIKGSRQHTFDFLRGDLGKTGRKKLPVDVYYETLNLVIEFNEQQHTKAVKHFDKPDKLTVSGVHRGEQRKIYDKRKRDVLPKHSIKVIDLVYSDFLCDSKGKLIRDIAKDKEVLKNCIKNFLK